MPLNLPTVTTAKVSFGPGKLFLGASGATPTVDVGAVDEGGFDLVIKGERADLLQGNPKLIEYSWWQAQSVQLVARLVEWNYTTLAYALGAGNTTTTGSKDTYEFGGEPLCTTVALHAQHQMAVSGDTLNYYIWKAVSDGEVKRTWGHALHNYEASWTAQRSATNWAAVNLDLDEQLIKIEQDL